MSSSRMTYSILPRALFASMDLLNGKKTTLPKLVAVAKYKIPLFKGF